MKLILSILLLAPIFLQASCSRQVRDASIVTGAVWTISYVSPTGEARSFDIEFHEGGKAEWRFPAGGHYCDSYFTTKGFTLMLNVNNGYATYTGTLDPASGIIKGNAVNKLGKTWTWTMTRKPDSGREKEQ